MSVLMNRKVETMNIALIGPSGAGKGTHADRLTREYDMLHISTGDLFRTHFEQRTALGLLARKYMSQGELVPDEIVDAMVDECLLKAHPSKGILFDGYPRTRYQARFLDDILSKRNRTLDAVIYLKISDQEALRRLPGRLMCHKCPTPFHREFQPFEQCHHDNCHGEHLYQREDDTPEIARHRLRVFHRQTAHLIEYYKMTGQLFIVDGDGSIETVYAALDQAFQAIRARELRQASPLEAMELQALRQPPPILTRQSTEYKSLDLVLLGAPGSGKGTQAARLSTRFKVPHIATGDLFRENLRKQTELGTLAKSYMERGELVPDEITESMLRKRLQADDVKNGFILDGFPRTLSQAEALSEIMFEMQRGLAGVLYIKVSDKEIVNRLSGRLICRKCQTPFHKIYNPFITCPTGECQGEFLYQREDDNPETVRARLRAFHLQTRPLVRYYEEQNLLYTVDGEGELEDVSERVEKTVKKMLV